MYLALDGRESATHHHALQRVSPYLAIHHTFRQIAKIEGEADFSLDDRESPAYYQVSRRTTTIKTGVWLPLDSRECALYRHVERCITTQFDVSRPFGVTFACFNASPCVTTCSDVSHHVLQCLTTYHHVSPCAFVLRNFRRHHSLP